MKIQSTAVAGTLESSDVYVKAEPHDTLEIMVDSVVLNQFGEQIYASIREVLEEQHITEGKITVKDRGAIDCVIKARVETAILRAGGNHS